MALEKITHFFDPLRRQPENNILQKLRERLVVVSGTAESDGSEMSREDFMTFLHELFLGIGSFQFSLKDGEADEILEQLNCGLEGHSYDHDIFIACWNYWLRDQISYKPSMVVVDVQNDFISGSLALKHCPAGNEGYDVVPVINNILQEGFFDIIAYTKDWHPASHCSFIDNVGLYPIHSTSPLTASEAKVFDTVIYANPKPMKQKLWPVHCVEESWGAELHTKLKPPEENDIVIIKGNDPSLDSYSAFWNNTHFSQTSLFKDLLAQGVSDVYVGGLALDYCVKFTAIDAAQHGFRTFVIEDATRVISDEGCCLAKKNLSEAGVKMVNSAEISKMVGHDKRQARVI